MSDTKKTLPALPFKRLPLSRHAMRPAVLMMAAVLLTACQDGEKVVAGTCEGSAQKVEAIAPLAVGELAAFIESENPEKLPELSFKNSDGQSASMAEYEGKTVLFNLWATWCAPCRHEMPSFDALQAELSDEAFAVVPVSVDRGGSEKPLAFYEEIGLKHLPFYQDETMGVFNELKKKSLAFGLPATLLLDEKGCILGSLNGPAEWNSEDAKRLVRAAMGG